MTRIQCYRRSRAHRPVTRERLRSISQWRPDHINIFSHGANSEQPNSARMSFKRGSNGRCGIDRDRSETHGGAIALSAAAFSGDWSADE